MKRIASTFLFAFALWATIVPSAQALLTIEYRSPAYTPGFGLSAAPGDTFNLNVFVSYQATPPDLLSIFTSSRWDPSELELLGATTAPGAIFGGPGGALFKLSDPGTFPLDPPGTLRTIQFAAFPSHIAVTPADDVFITTLSFRVLSQGISSLPVEAFIAVGTDDIAAGEIGGAVRSLGPPDVQFLHVVPEPGTALLVGMGLAALSGSRERGRSARWKPRPARPAR